MSDELLSAMMDGQCTPDEVRQTLAAMDNSPALKARWSRMMLARDALAGVRVARATPDFALNVMAAIKADAEQAEPVNPKVVPLRRVAVPAAAVAAVSPVRSRRWQPAIGLAAAASITAAVVVFGGNVLTSPVGPTQRALQASAGGSAETAATIAQVKAAEVAAAGGVAETRWSQIDAAQARQLNDYLMEHSNSRSESGMGGSLSYARLAVRTADYRQAEEPR